MSAKDANQMVVGIEIKALELEPISHLEEGKLGLTTIVSFTPHLDQWNHTANYLGLSLHRWLWSVKLEVIQWLLHLLFSLFTLDKTCNPELICHHSSTDSKLGLAGQTRQTPERLQRWGHLGIYREHRWFRLNINVSAELRLPWSMINGIYKWGCINTDKSHEATDNSYSHPRTGHQSLVPKANNCSSSRSMYLQ